MTRTRFDDYLLAEAELWAGRHGWPADCTPDCPPSCWAPAPRYKVSPEVALRLTLAERDGWSCHYCSVSLLPDDGMSNLMWVKFPDGRFARFDDVRSPSVDHKHPRSLGGSDDLDNLVLACGLCNEDKRATPYDTYVAALQEKRSA